MIIAICTDDPDVNLVARTAENDNFATFGRAYDAFDRGIPDLGQNENLFILAHGAAIAEEGSPVIGSQANDFYLTPRDLNTNLHVFPRGYTGDIYISACESATPGSEDESFVDQFYTILQRSFPHSKVYGHIGDIAGELPPPGDPSWQAAAIVIH